ncbi:complement factor H-related protein 4-like isoform X8 [Ahaetulla prasina]|uniref:complement factor H-related protein 4-like isoform X8 n=1 Tax=Ahaetulla prasina TaxID=499056 RepID=UPI00264858BE|nr:complement factor H-related protein 4-like isoform X8 [Ahaetulla prasina]
MKAWLLLVAVLLLWPGFSSQNACDEPDEIDFGEIVSAEKAKYLENDRVQYRCYPSYVLEGPEWIQCKGQEWTPHLPKCLAPCSITRQQLAAKNLFVFGNQRKARLIQSNQRIQLQCNKGHVLVVPSVRKCVDGYMDLPLCISERGQNCSGPPRTENGDITTLSEKQYRSGSSVEFRCQTYYALEGQKRSFCDNGTWTKVPICLDPCMIPKTELESQKIEVKDEIDAPENIFVQRGHSIELTCRTGYVLAANSSQSVFVIQCDGTPPVIPKCKEITCNSPRISNGTFRPQRTIYHDGDLVRIHCDNGFTFEPDNGEKVVECTKNGWSPPPKCIKKGCDYIQIENGRMANLYELYRPFPIAEEQSIYFYCYDGFLPANKETWQTATCIKSQYVPELKCFKKCDTSLRINNGHFASTYQGMYIEGNNITFVCDKGYSPADQQSTSTCTKNGWSPPPSCILPAPCTTREEDMRQRNIRLKWTQQLSIYIEEGNLIEFRCIRGYQPRPSSSSFRVQCMEGKLHYPDCIPI